MVLCITSLSLFFFALLVQTGFYLDFSLPAVLPAQTPARLEPFFALRVFMTCFP